MKAHRYFRRAARYLSRGGFTLVELLVVIGIIAILAGVALGPITRGIKQAQENATVQVAHQIGVLEFAYSNDFNQIYPAPTGASGTGNNVADVLLNGGYSSTPSLFYVANTPLAAKYTGSTNPYSMSTATHTVNWDFMYNVTGTTGLTSSSSDSTPLVQLTGGTAPTMAVTFASPGATLALATNSTAFGADGIAVYYKGNNAKFLKGVSTGTTSATIAGWIDTTFNDPNGLSYGLTTPF
jgi:prepilin-type N-terminal cleavage/methylation domain-containing protein